MADSDDSDDSDDGGDGGIDGRTIALGALALAGIVLVVRVLRGGGETEADEGFEFGDDGAGDGADDDGADPTDDLPVDAPEGVSERFDEIDVVDAVYIVVAGLKAARDEYRRRTDDGDA